MRGEDGFCFLGSATVSVETVEDNIDSIGKSRESYEQDSVHVYIPAVRHSETDHYSPTEHWFIGVPGGGPPDYIRWKRTKLVVGEGHHVMVAFDNPPGLVFLSTPGSSLALQIEMPDTVHVEATLSLIALGNPAPEFRS